MTTMPRPTDGQAPVVETARPASRPPRAGRDRRVAGLLLSIAGVVILMGSITAEALHPGPYTTHADTLSHLGASEPPDSVVVQPSAGIFDGTVLVAGALILLGAWFAHRALHRRAVTVPMALLGLGVLGVGVFPLTNPGMHTVFAMLAFYSGGVAVLLSARVTPSPFRQLWAVLGVVSLVAITLGVFALDWAPVAALGEGGIERWNSYPIVLWLVAFGSHLIATAAGDPGSAR
ncbi:hypothetical membrane protein [Geodermatophilus obscurus]|uniref:Hypothetical membrane protein n=1 Tax=Geodermatophilus obscurus TaxID=1861 RepID=A0A1M7UZM1_9ACTN|nr:DUF998 domain-containing protein [Geodermatophilus obscurus]SHN88387.1 hypothetical membrane protein [Geodermatophilus obscurus]